MTHYFLALSSAPADAASVVDSVPINSTSTGCETSKQEHVVVPSTSTYSVSESAPDSSNLETDQQDKTAISNPAINEKAGELQHFNREKSALFQTTILP